MPSRVAFANASSTMTGKFKCNNLDLKKKH